VSQSLANNLIHLVFSTKERRPLLRDAERDRLHAYMGGILKNHECQPIEINSVADHAHVLFVLGKNLALAKAIELTKGLSSGWLKDQAEWYSDFKWQTGYWAFSVSPTHVPPLRRYILGQQEHHAKVGFQDEVRRLAAKNGVELDERYAWN
jgi:putative transposase